MASRSFSLRRATICASLCTRWGFFAAALSARAQDAQVRHLVGSIHASVEALERLFSALMDISKLDAGVVAPKRTTFALAPLLERLEREFASPALAKGLSFRVVRTGLWVESDPVLLERILANLASNAVRYTERGGVVLGARRRSGTVSLEAWDTGVGIAASECERIFEEFYQGGAARRSGSGMGLGLAIIRRLAMLLDHRVHVRSLPEKGLLLSDRSPPCLAAPARARSAVRDELRCDTACRRLRRRCRRRKNRCGGDAQALLASLGRHRDWRVFRRCDDHGTR